MWGLAGRPFAPDGYTMPCVPSQSSPSPRLCPRPTVLATKTSYEMKDLGPPPPGGIDNSSRWWGTSRRVLVCRLQDQLLPPRVWTVIRYLAFPTWRLSEACLLQLRLHEPLVREQREVYIKTEEHNSGGELRDWAFNVSRSCIITGSETHTSVDAQHLQLQCPHAQRKVSVRPASFAISGASKYGSRGATHQALGNGAANLSFYFRPDGTPALASPFSQVHSLIGSPQPVCSADLPARITPIKGPGWVPRSADERAHARTGFVCSVFLFGILGRACMDREGGTQGTSGPPTRPG